jgi:hypothetical protein
MFPTKQLMVASACSLALSIPASAQQTTSSAFRVDVGGIEQELYSGSEALLIYGADYRRGWTDLDTIPGDMNELSTVLGAHGFNVQVLANKTGPEIEFAVNSFIRKHGGSNKRIFIYWAGHGWKSPEGEGFLVPVDAPLPAADIQGFREAAIPVTGVQYWANQIRSRHAVMIFDACFAGTIFTDRGEPKPPDIPTGSMSPPMFDKIKPNSVTYISATDELTPVPAQSDFTQAIIAGLRGSADKTGDGYIMTVELSEWIKEQFLNDDRYKPQAGPTTRHRWSDSGVVFRSPTGPQPGRGQRQAAIRPRLIRVSQATSSPPSTKEYVAASPPPARAATAEQLVQGDWFISYFKKVGDGDRVTELLRNQRLRYLIEPGNLPPSRRSNAVACHPEADVSGVKALALLLHDSGIPVAAIASFRSPKEKPVNRLEIISVDSKGQPWAAAPLTRQQIEQLTKCKRVNNGRSGRT